MSTRSKFAYPLRSKKYLAMNKAKVFANLAKQRIPKGQARQMLSNASKMSAVVGGVVVGGPQGPERKKFDNNVTATNVLTGTPYIASLTATIAEGTGLANRVGAQIHHKAIDVELNCTLAVGASATLITSGAAFMDVFLVWDKQPDGAVPTAATVLQSAATNLTFSNVINLERFVILKRESVELDLASCLGKVIRWHQPLDCASRFNDATASPATNDFYILAVSPSAAAGTTGINPQIAYVARVTFTDS